MTFSILTFDRNTGILAAAAATGSLCVGGWVLRGDIEAGLVASQGTAPSSFWRDGVLRMMHAGAGADEAVRCVTTDDIGRGHRQLTALDLRGGTGGFTGADSVAHASHFCAPGIAISGNMLAGPQVLVAMRDMALDESLEPPARMLAALRAANRAGGDRRGLQSAALLVLAPDHPPLDLRIDCSDDPLTALDHLCLQATSSPYRDWLDEVPVLKDRMRAPGIARSGHSTMN